MQGVGEFSAGGKTVAEAYIKTAKRMLIGGEWVDAVDGETIECIDPATERVIAHIPAGSTPDVDAAVAHARLAFETGPWPKTSPKERGQLLWHLADLIEKNVEEFAAIDTFDNGAPLVVTEFMVRMGCDMLRYYAGMATKIYGQTADISDSSGDFHAFTRMEAVGVVGLISPWNGPTIVLCNKIAPAIAAGCTCVVKPAELTSLSAIRLGELIQEAGFPAGVINIVTGYGAKAGDAMAHHPGIDKISFTGSTAVGKSLIQASAGNLKRLTLELGGKSPLIIFDDADLEAAIPAAAMAIFSLSGQVCHAGSRLFVQSKVYDRVLEGVCNIAGSLKLGGGFEPDTALGPVVSAKQRARVMDYIDKGRSDGASVMIGGEAVGSQGYFIEPTVFANARVDAAIMREEIFGPVLVATRFDDVDAMVAAANNTEYGLGSGVFTQDIKKAHAVANRLRAGNVWINCYGIFDPSMPFGGYKQSGWGREFGTEGLSGYLERKSVFSQVS